MFPLTSPQATTAAILPHVKAAFSLAAMDRPRLSIRSFMPEISRHVLVFGIRMNLALGELAC